MGNGHSLRGVQAEGTIGRQFRNGATSVRIMGKFCDVYARMEALDAFSAHDNQFEFLDWIRGFNIFPEKAFVNHGEKIAAMTCAKDPPRVRGEVYFPRMWDSIGLSMLGRT